MSRAQASASRRRAVPMPRTAILFILALTGCASGPSVPAPMTFFVTSVGTGRGADFRGLQGADAHCQRLADAAGAGTRTWRAYLSAQSRPGVPAVHARERIGAGPWHNARGELIARDVKHLHGEDNHLDSRSALSERSETISGRAHDILTGSRADGTAPSPLDPDMTCSNWTSDADGGGAVVGHHDRASAIREPWARSWNSAHRTRGCSVARLKELGSSGLIYCFAE